MLFHWAVWFDATVRPFFSSSFTSGCRKSCRKIRWSLYSFLLFTAGWGLSVNQFSWVSPAFLWHTTLKCLCWHGFCFNFTESDWSCLIPCYMIQYHVETTHMLPCHISCKLICTTINTTVFSRSLLVIRPHRRRANLILLSSLKQKQLCFSWTHSHECRNK